MVNLSHGIAAESGAPVVESEGAWLETPSARIALPVIKVAEGPAGVEVDNLLKETNMVTFDPGFMNTAAVESAVSFVDGDNGILRYRGYPIEQLAANSSFLEVAYLLIYGELPTEQVLKRFSQQVNRHTLLPENYRALLNAFPKTAHPMAMMASAMSALETFYPESLNPRDEDQIDLATTLILAKIRTITSYVFKAMSSKPFLYPDKSRSYVEDFMRMCFAVPYETFDSEPELVRILDKLLILHADHEQNCSTSTVRLVGSSNASVYASVAAGIGALSGPAHGGANEAVLNMLNQIANGEDSVKSFVAKVKDKKDGVRLMGFGHRIYKSYDPRAKIIKTDAHAILDKYGSNDGLLAIARELEELALGDDYFTSRKLYPNVDFYTGLIYRAIGFPPTMFTPLFAFGRTPGWIAQWREMAHDPDTRIGRPRQLYVGQPQRDYLPVSERIMDENAKRIAAPRE
ncbi:MAG: citrate synthase [Cellulomonadaceae bacterium]|jgi:citrate synthase|nr:citrate synthase [Cellulomonadaceae bacterium]